MKNSKEESRCPFCGKKLPKNRHWRQQYCTPSHRVMASRQRMKEKQEQESQA